MFLLLRAEVNHATRIRGENPTTHPGQKDWSHGARISTCRILARGLLLPHLTPQGQINVTVQNAAEDIAHPLVRQLGQRCVRERVYVDRLYFKLAASHSRGNLNNAEDVRAYIFNVWLCHVFYFIDCYVLTLIICHK